MLQKRNKPIMLSVCLEMSLGHQDIRNDLNTYLDVCFTPNSNAFPARGDLCRYKQIPPRSVLEKMCLTFDNSGTLMAFLIFGESF